MIRIGKIVATHGLTGSLVMTHVAGTSKWLAKGHMLMIELQKGSSIPYFIAEVKAVNNEEYIVNLEDVVKIEDAKKLVAKHVYVDEKLIAAHAKDSPLMWIGFAVTDKQSGALGAIEDVVQTGKQWLARIMYQGAEVLIPLIPQVINKVDVQKKAISVTLPDGLLEVYLDK